MAVEPEGRQHDDRHHRQCGEVDHRPADVGMQDAGQAGGADATGQNMNKVVDNKIEQFFSSDRMKELLESKFRAIDVYLKTDLIPKVVKREITKLQETA